MLSDGHATADGDRTARQTASAHATVASGRTRRAIVRIGVLGVGLLVAVGTASAQHGGGAMGGYGAGGFPGLGLVFWLLVALGVVALLVYARDGRRPGATAETDAGRMGRDRALETLRERYARGELSDEEFERRRTELERTH